MNSLPDIRMVNEMMLTLIRASQKVSDPPLMAPFEGFILPLTTAAGRINYRKSMNPLDKIEPIITGGNIPVNLEIIRHVQQSINSAFFADMFLALTETTKRMTVPEVQERVAEKMLILGPTLGRIMSEMLSPLIERTFNIALNKGYISAPPQEILKFGYEIEYVSPLAKAQRAAELGAIQQLMQIALTMAQAAPQVMDLVNSDEMIKSVADVTSVPPKILNDDGSVEKIRKQRQQQINIQNAQQQANMYSDTVQKMSKADKNAQEANGQPT